jgi:hypothetical protein
MSQTGWILLGLGAVFMLVGAVLIATFAINRKKAIQSRTWPTSPGRVVTSRVNDRTDSDDEGGTTTYYQAEVVYEYAVEGETLQGNRIAFGSAWTTDRGSQLEITNRYPTGSAVTVHHRPGNPGDAVLETSVGSGSTLFLVLGIVFDTIGTGLLIGGILAR